MSFERILQTIVDECGGGIGAALMGLDGIAIAQARASARPADDPLHGEITTAGIEFGRILAEAAKASEALGTGALREAVLTVERLQVIFHTVDDDLVLVLALSPDGNLGKARYLLRRHVIEVRSEL